MGFLPFAAESNPTHPEPMQVFLLERITETLFTATPKVQGRGLEKVREVRPSEAGGGEGN